MADKKKNVPINYTNREFETIKRDLTQLAERFYPDTFQDFSQASFGSMVLDSVAYVADQLSFYLDYNVNESFLDTAYQYQNIHRHGKILGYKDMGRPSTYGKVAVFVLVPASPTGMGPDREYIPILKKGTIFSATGGGSFILTENIDFSDPRNPIVVAKTEPTTGAPTFYGIKSYGNVVSGRYGTERVVVGEYERYKNITLNERNISEILSVFDAQGNEYYEVDYLSQDMIYKELSNTNFKNDNVPSILKPILVSRKFVVVRNGVTMQLQFGSGKDGETGIIADPAAVAMNAFGKEYISDTTFDPSRLTKNDAMGIVPANTTLIINYRVTNPTNSNYSAGSVNNIVNVSVDFNDRNTLAESTIRQVVNSIEVYNEEPIVGDVTNPTPNEIKRRIYDTFPTQNRAVTQADYENIIYRMPSKYGSVKRCSVQRDPDSRRRNLNTYVISEDRNGNFIKTNNTIKNNLKTWINNYRMLSDTVDVLDAYIINFGIDFSVRPTKDADKFSLVDKCIEELKKKFQGEKYFIGEAISVSDIYQKLSEVEGVLSVLNVTIKNKKSGNYSSVSYDINNNMSPSGDSIIIPKNAVAELKFPSVDITGKIR